MTAEPTGRAFRWLHLSGPKISERTATRRREVLQAIAEDVRAFWNRQIVHAVIISGDVGSTGAHRDYEAAGTVLDEFLDHLASTQGVRPRLVVVPGNHDVDRRALPAWLTESVNNPNRRLALDPSVRDGLEDAFRPYDEWANVSHTSGMPGDTATLIEGDGLTVGVIGLNTAIGDLADGSDAAGGLPLFSDQFDQLLDRGGRSILDDGDEALLVTHHGPRVLSTQGRAILYGTVRTRDRFACHLFESDDRGDRRFSMVQLPREMEIATTGLPVRGPLRYNLCELSVDDGHRTIVVAPRVTTEERTRFEPDLGYPLDLTEGDRLVVTCDRPSVPANRSHTAVPDPDEPAPSRLRHLVLSNYRGLSHVSLPFTQPSMLGGSWTCIAGINGAGKSSILEAICLGLLGEPLVRELGGTRLEAMRRRDTSTVHDAVIQLWVEIPEPRYVEIIFGGPEQLSTRPVVADELIDTWSRLRSKLLCAYGATRNLSSGIETGSQYMSPELRPVMSLFQALTQLSAAESFLDASHKIEPALRELVVAVLNRVFDGIFKVGVSRNELRFSTGSGTPLPARSLPDGFRSSAAFLIDLCVHAFERGRFRDPERIEGFVLLDELGLHLHASLEREIVPRLREALPRLDWVATTHSPLVLASFDRREIIALDPERPDGFRQPDRQILSFTADEVYELLLDTPPGSLAAERLLAEAGSRGGPDPRELEEMIRQSPTTSAADARQEADRFASMIDSYRSRKGTSS